MAKKLNIKERPVVMREVEPPVEETEEDKLARQRNEWLTRIQADHAVRVDEQYAALHVAEEKIHEEFRENSKANLIKSLDDLDKFYFGSMPGPRPGGVKKKVTLATLHNLHSLVHEHRRLFDKLGDLYDVPVRQDPIRDQDRWIVPYVVTVAPEKEEEK